MLVSKPPMGWNSWNTFGENISADLIRETADKIIELGLDKAGYKYLVIDDCWSRKQRDPKTDKIVPDKKKFPKGMKDVSNYIHSKGLKFGMYSCAGVMTCAGYPGSFDHEFLDAKTFAEYGCDYLKYDFCHRPWTADSKVLYRRMGHALRLCGRDILFSACQWGLDDVWSWIRSTGAHMYRSTGDIFDTGDSFSKIAKSQVDKYCFSGPQCFNDMDMLTVGMYGKGNVGFRKEKMSKEEKALWFRRYQSQFSLWCLMGSPLMLGCDLRTMDKDILKLVTNKEMIAINQDAESRPAFPVYSSLWWAGDPQERPHLLLVRLLEDGDLAVGVFNFSDDAVNLNLYFEEIGFPVSSGYDLSFKNIYTGEVSTARESMAFKPEAHGCLMYRVTPVKR